MQSLTIAEASVATRLGRTKLYELINAGALRARKIGKRTIILREDLDSFLSDLPPYPAQKGGTP